MKNLGKLTKTLVSKLKEGLVIVEGVGIVPNFTTSSGYNYLSTKVKFLNKNADLLIIEVKPGDHNALAQKAQQETLYVTYLNGLKMLVYNVTTNKIMYEFSIKKKD